MSTLIRRFLEDYKDKENLSDYKNFLEKSLYFEKEKTHIIPLISYMISYKNEELINYFSRREIINFENFHTTSEEKDRSVFFNFGVWIEIYNKEKVFLFKSIKINTEKPFNLNLLYPLLVLTPTGDILYKILFLEKETIQELFIKTIDRIRKYRVSLVNHNKKDGIFEIFIDSFINVIIEKNKVRINYLKNSAFLCNLMKISPDFLPIVTIHRVTRLKSSCINEDNHSVFFIHKNKRGTFTLESFLYLPPCFIPNWSIASTDMLEVKIIVLLYIIRAVFFWFNKAPFFPLNKRISDIGLYFFTNKNTSFIGGFLLVGNYLLNREYTCIRVMQDRIEITGDFNTFNKIKNEFKDRILLPCGNYKGFIPDTIPIDKVIKFIKLLNKKVILVKRVEISKLFFVEEKNIKYILLVRNLSFLWNNYYRDFLRKNFENIIRVFKEKESDEYFAIIGKVKNKSLKNISQGKVKNILKVGSNIFFENKEVVFKNIEEIIKEEVNNDSHIEIL